MWFLNKETGLKWEVSNADLQERLSNSPDFEVIEEDAEEVKTSVEDLVNQNVNQSTNVPTDGVKVEIQKDEVIVPTATKDVKVDKKKPE